jgi:hypothetical protein
MSLLNLALVIATVVAFGIGLTVKGSWRLKFGLCFLIAILGWGFRALAILNGDATIAGDYFGGLNMAAAIVEVAVALVWTAFWCALGTSVARTMRRRKSEPQ